MLGNRVRPVKPVVNIGEACPQLLLNPQISDFQGAYGFPYKSKKVLTETKFGGFSRPLRTS